MCVPNVFGYVVPSFNVADSLLSTVKAFNKSSSVGFPVAGLVTLSVVTSCSGTGIDVGVSALLRFPSPLVATAVMLRFPLTSFELTIR